MIEEINPQIPEKKVFFKFWLILGIVLLVVLVLAVFFISRGLVSKNLGENNSIENNSSVGNSSFLDGSFNITNCDDLFLGLSINNPQLVLSGLKGFERRPFCFFQDTESEKEYLIDPLTNETYLYSKGNGNRSIELTNDLIF